MVQPIRQFVAFVKVRNALPQGVHQFDGRQAVVVPQPFVDLLAPFVVLDRLHAGRRAQACTVAGGADDQHPQVGQPWAITQAIVRQHLGIALFLDGRLHAVGRAQLGQHLRPLAGVGLTDLHLQAAERLPGQGWPVVQQAQHLIAQHRAAAITHTHEVTAIAGGGHAHRARDLQGDVLPAIGRGHQLWRHLHVHGFFGDALAQLVQQLLA